VPGTYAPALEWDLRTPATLRGWVRYELHLVLSTRAHRPAARPGTIDRTARRQSALHPRPSGGLPKHHDGLDLLPGDVNRGIELYQQGGISHNLLPAYCTQAVVRQALGDTESAQQTIQKSQGGLPRLGSHSRLGGRGARGAFGYVTCCSPHTSGVGQTPEVHTRSGALGRYRGAGHSRQWNEDAGHHWYGPSVGGTTDADPVPGRATAWVVALAPPTRAGR
jgi:hypothetical protein